MNLKETLRYMEAQIPLKENLDSLFRKYKAILKKQNPKLNNGELDNQVAQKLAADKTLNLGMDAQTILKTVRQNTTYGKYVADSKNLQGNAAMYAYEDAQAIGHKNVKIAPIQNGGLKQYYNDMKTGEDLKNSIDSFNNQLSQQISNFENLKNQLTQISKQYKAQGKQTQNLDATLSEAEQSLAEVKQNDANSKNIFKGIGSLLKGALNAVAGVAGNFIGGIASGMGGAR